MANNTLTSIEGGSSPSVFSKLRRKLSPKRKVEEPHDVHLSIDLDAALKRDQLEQVFLYFDEDGDGKISPWELQSCLRSLGSELSSAEAASVVESLDSDGDGLLGLEDFTKLMEANGEEKNKDLKEAFRMYEMDGSGCITPKSLKKMLSRLGEDKTIEECKSIISVFDLDDDGVLSFEEFSAMMR